MMLINMAYTKSTIFAKSRVSERIRNSLTDCNREKKSPSGETLRATCLCMKQIYSCNLKFLYDLSMVEINRSETNRQIKKSMNNMMPISHFKICEILQ